MPADVVDLFGYAIHLAQNGGKHVQAKPLKGFGSAGVLEVVEDDDGNTYRAVYIVRFSNAIYVLFSEEIAQGYRHTKAGYGFNS